jgi:hypothetical protein
MERIWYATSDPVSLRVGVSTPEEKKMMVRALSRGGILSAEILCRQVVFSTGRGGFYLSRNSSGVLAGSLTKGLISKRLLTE